MTETPFRQVLSGAIIFCLCMALLLFLRLLPLPGFMGWPGPDIALCLAFAWVLRRPDTLPAIVILAAFLLEDVILLRPLGLWTLFVVLGVEFARSREERWREQAFVFEWLRVATLISAMMVGYRFVQILFMLPVPALGQVLLQLIATIMAYPLVTYAARWLIGLRRITPAEADMMRYGR